MVTRIEKDVGRFNRILKGKVRDNLKKYINQGEMIAKKGDEMVSVPVPQIDIPHFTYETRQKGGVGQGEGDEGDPVGGEEGEGGGGQAGNQPGQHMLEVELTIDELAELMGDELELPRIEPKGNKNVESVKNRYKGISPVGPDSLRHFKRTYREALKRQIASKEYDYKNPVIVPIRKDQRYRTRQPVPEEQTNAVIILMMDVSGSMEEEQKEIVRIESFWIDTWLRSHYKGLETCYIIHDTVAKEVDKDTFFRTKESGGTVISSAYKLAINIIEERYPPDEWNIYPFHFSDGDNWSEKDNDVCLQLLADKMVPFCNMFGYGQVESRYGSGKFIKELEKKFKEEDTVILSKIENKQAIVKSIKEFLGKGK